MCVYAFELTGEVVKLSSMSSENGTIGIGLPIIRSASDRNELHRVERRRQWSIF